MLSKNMRAAWANKLVVELILMKKTLGGDGMAHLIPDKLHIRWMENVSRDTFSLPRCYTLTHSDATGDLFLTIGVEIDAEQIAGWHTRCMRDEVTAEWRRQEGGYQLHLDCHVSGGVVFGPAGQHGRR